MSNEESNIPSLFIRLEDDILLGLSLATKHSEENYYTNTMILTKEFLMFPQKINRAIRGVRTKMNWSHRITDLIYVSQGSFGRIYKATDNVTQREIALKNYLPKNETQHEHFLQLWRLFIEGNLLISVNRNPFVVQLVSIFRDEEQSSFWLFLDYCPFTFNELLYRCGAYIPHVARDSYLKENVNIVKIINDKVSQSLTSSFLDIIFIYYFEILAALDYMANRHYVHSFINGENILIARSGHVKVADVSIAERYRWVDKRVPIISMNDLRLKSYRQVDESDLKYEKNGNLTYSDPETIMRIIQRSDPSSYDFYKEKYKIAECPKNESYLKPNFMNDFYSTSLLIAQSMLGGFLFTQTLSYNGEDLNSFNLGKEELDYLIIPLTYNDDLFVKLVYDKIYQKTCSEYGKISLFVIGSLRRRENRNIKFCKDIEVKNKFITMSEKAVDIRKIEQLDWYKTRNITNENVVNVEINSLIMELVETITHERHEEASISSITINDKEFDRVFHGQNFLYNAT